MTMLPQSNARLISVTRGGLSEDYTRDPGTESPLWQGNVDAYVQQKIRSSLSDNGALLRVEDVTLYVTGDIPIDLRAGDIVTYRAGSPMQSTVLLQGKIQNVVNPAFLAMLPDYYKCSLEEANAVGDN